MLKSCVMVQGLLFLCPLPGDIVLKTLYFLFAREELHPLHLLRLGAFLLVCAAGGRLSAKGRILLMGVYVVQMAASTLKGNRDKRSCSQAVI